MSTPSVRPDLAVWFEIPAADFDRAVRFYETLLECKLNTQSFGPDQTAVFPSTPGRPGGCVIKGKDYTCGKDGVMIYLNAGASLDAALARVPGAGGRLAKGRTALPEGLGFFAHIVDTEGNRVGLHALA